MLFQSFIHDIPCLLLLVQAIYFSLQNIQLLCIFESLSCFVFISCFKFFNMFMLWGYLSLPFLFFRLKLNHLFIANLFYFVIEFKKFIVFAWEFFKVLMTFFRSFLFKGQQFFILVCSKLIMFHLLCNLLNLLFTLLDTLYLYCILL